MRRLLITGGAGFMGANFVHYWLSQRPDDRVVVLDVLSYAGSRINLAAVEHDPRHRFVHGDICDVALVADLFAQEQFDWVVHFAAESHVDGSIAGPDDFIRTNVLGTHVLLSCARAAWSRSGSMRSDVRFHHVSTDEVYGSLTSTDSRVTEGSTYAPNSPYSASKAAADHLVRAYHHTYGLPVTTSHSSNNYGPYQFPEKLLPLMLVNALEGRPLPLYGRGENIREWIYVTDHCRALQVILERGASGHVYNVGGCNQWRNIEAVRLLCALLDRRVREDGGLVRQFPCCPASQGRSTAELITFVSDRPSHDWRYALDTTKIRTQLGFTPSEPFEAGLAKTLDWYLANAAWWRRALAGNTAAGPHT